VDSYLKENGITVVHGQQYLFALKAQNAGVDAIVAEGFEAGGHGRDETTTFTLIPMVKEQNKNSCYSSGWYCKRTWYALQWH
jgi:enoyl-[acyl-carrier protein] reductase II